jgi:bifunctional DNA-binding transcriptional regulator/antitoxin component of YhaV-PrlF toxin-antitoxin module
MQLKSVDNYAIWLKLDKNMEKYVRKLTRVGKRSLAIVIPAEVVDNLKLKEKQKLTITTKGRSIVIKDWK